MIMEVAVGDGDPVRGVSDVNEAVVVILVLAQVAAEIKVIEPDIGGLLNSDAITALDLAELQIADDDILNVLDCQVDASDCCSRDLSASVLPKGCTVSDGVQAPDFPRTLVLAPILIEPVPLMLPDTMMIFLASPLAAELKAAKLETVVVVPPAPPVVLSWLGLVVGRGRDDID